ncbi:electron transporter [Pleurocapsales cyanobacterium LEGE 06147]|nr:electron transporter [Pleurocapsales cyanobacterium LEGE 06147]
MFAPIVVLLRRLLGKAKFNQLRGKAIAIHAQAITNFCDRLGIESKEKQNLIRIARDNGKRVGLLA